MRTNEEWKQHVTERVTELLHTLPLLPSVRDEWSKVIPLNILGESDQGIPLNLLTVLIALSPRVYWCHDGENYSCVDREDKIDWFKEGPLDNPPTKEDYEEFFYKIIQGGVRPDPKVTIYDYWELLSGIHNHPFLNPLEVDVCGLPRDDKTDIIKHMLLCSMVGQELIVPRRVGGYEYCAGFGEILPVLAWIIKEFK